jgi:hypothetical protein
MRDALVLRFITFNPRADRSALRAGSLCPRAETSSHLAPGPYLDILVVRVPCESFCERSTRRHLGWLKLNTTCFGSAVS